MLKIVAVYANMRRNMELFMSFAIAPLLMRSGGMELNTFKSNLLAYVYCLDALPTRLGMDAQHTTAWSLPAIR